MKGKAVVLLALLISFQPQAFANQKEAIACPTAITQDFLAHLSESSTGWTTSVRAELVDGTDLLNEARLFSGPPEEMVELSSYDSTKNTATWIHLDNEFYLQRHFWIGCYYKNSTAALFKEVVIHPSKCVVLVKERTSTSDKQIIFTCSN